ncbi:TPA: hypothetical protein ACGCO1_002809 [Legionella pneumophila]
MVKSLMCSTIWKDGFGAVVPLWASLKNSRCIGETIPILFYSIDDDTDLGNLL